MDREQLSNLSGPDAVVALRSYSRRFRELLAAAEAEPAASDRADVELGPVVAVLEEATRYLQGLHDALSQTLVVGDAVHPASLFVRPVPARGATSAEAPGACLDRLTDRLASLAATVERTPPKDWSRPMTVGGVPGDAHEILREAVAYGRSALDLAAATLDAARRDAN